MVCYYLCYISCKLWMQRVSFTIPLCLATPGALLVFFLEKRYAFLGDVTSNSDSPSVMWPDDLLSHWRTLAPGLAWFVSLMILTRHAWFPRQSRLAKIEV